jgi:hypothetical protein
MKFALGMTDARAASALTSLDTISGYGLTSKYGLGTATNGAKIGAYSIEISNQTPDTGTADKIYSMDGGTTWASLVGAWNTQSIIAFSNSATSKVPSAHKSMSIDLRVVAAVDKTSNLPISSAITIDGLTTVEVKYL